MWGTFDIAIAQYDLLDSKISSFNFSVSFELVLTLQGYYPCVYHR